MEAESAFFVFCLALVSYLFTFICVDPSSAVLTVHVDVGGRGGGCGCCSGCRSCCGGTDIICWLKV